MRDEKGGVNNDGPFSCTREGAFDFGQFWVKDHTMPKRMVTLIFPQTLIKEPVIYRLSRQFNIIPNIRRARVTENAGELMVELDGEEEELNKGIAYLNGLGDRGEESRRPGRKRSPEPWQHGEGEADGI